MTLKQWELGKQAIEYITSIPPEERRTLPLPADLKRLPPRVLLWLVDTGFLATNGFQFCFPEYAEACRRKSA